MLARRFVKCRTRLPMRAALTLTFQQLKKCYFRRTSYRSHFPLHCQLAMNSSRLQNAISEAEDSQSPHLRIKRALYQLLKFGLATAVVVYLISHGYIAWEPLRASLAEWQFSLPAFIILALTPLGQFWRWQSLLRSGGLFLPNREVFSYVMVSKFFNMAFPGYVSGDILRGVYVHRRTSEEINRSGAQSEAVSGTLNGGPQAVVASILFDRAAGLLPLFVLCLMGLVGTVWYPLPPRLVLTVAVIASAGLAGVIFLFLFVYFLPQPPELLIRLARRLRWDQSLCCLHEVAHRYVRDQKLIASILGISFVTQGAGVLSFVLFGWALKVDLPLVGYLILVPLGLMVTAIPVTTAGLGVGQVAFLSLFQLIGTSQGANLFTLYAASYVLINLSGAFVYLSSRISGLLPRAPKPVSIQKE